ncbi:MAG: hypothetical protein WAZ99_06910 [Rectinemataceae bacterium]
MEWQPLGDFRMRNRGPDMTVVDFGVLTLVFRYEERVLRMRFECTDPEATGFRIRLGAKPGERILGGGPRSGRIDLKNRDLHLCAQSEAIPSFMSDEGVWMKVAAPADLKIRFSASHWALEAGGFPESVSLGFPRGMGEAFEGLSAEAGVRHAPPARLFSGVILDCRGLGADASAAAEAAADAGVRVASFLGDPTLPDENSRAREVGGTVGNVRTEVARLDDFPGDFARSLCGAFPGTGVFPGAKVPRILSHSFSASGYGYLAVDDFPGTGAGFERWQRNLEAAAFSPLLVVCAPGKGIAAAAAREGLARMARVSEHYAALESYHRECARAWTDEGLPPYRSSAVHYPDETRLWAQQDQYLYGRDILVAPAIEPGKRARTLFLPRDRWIHLWSSRVFGPGETTVDAPPGRPAVFYRESSPFASQFDALRRQAARS